MIVCAGEALIDMLPRRTAAGEDAFAPYVGGAVFNTARALARLGTRTSFVCGVSTDFFGEMLIDALKAADVETELTIRSDRPTTLAFVRLIDGQASYVFYDENSALRMIEPEDMPALPEATKALVFGCISLIGEPGALANEALMPQAAPDPVIMIAPNIRAGFITEEASYRARITRMIGMSDIIKLSDEDLAWLSPGADLEAHAKELIAGGASLVCITEGSRGARGITRNHNVFVPAEKVDVIDTVGAGDTFNAGVLAALDRADLLTKPQIAALSETQLTDALTLGVKSAAVTVSRAGANPPWTNEV